jgi:carboxyl-terminal processing protease
LRRPALAATAAALTLATLAAIAALVLTQSGSSRPSLVGEVRADLAARYVRPLTPAELRAPSVDDLLARLDDPYTVYLSPPEYRAIQAETTGTMVGIGLRLAPGRASLRVLDTFPGSPAERAGLRPGDEITAVDGLRLQGGSLADALARLQGGRGTTVILRFHHPADDTLLTAGVVRRWIPLDPVRAHDVGRGADRVRIIRIASFSSGVARQVRRLAFGAPAVLLDVRGDPGGLLQEAVATADVFLPSGVIVSWSGAHTTRQIVHSNGSATAAMPVAVLVDRRTASAAEILAGALQDHHRGVIVGTRTFGKATIQVVVPLTTGGALKLTAATYRTPAGHDLHGRGVLPDVPARHNALARALALLDR